MDFFQLIEHINTSENAIQFLRDRGILRSVPPVCTHPLCAREMTEVRTGKRRRSGGDDKIWRCPAHKNKKESIRKGSQSFGR
jgi:Rieske Fe-S protein